MAETPFEHDLQAMFSDAPPTADTDAFALTVDRRIGRGLWLQAGLLLAFGLVGVALSVVLAGPSLLDFSSFAGLIDLAGGLTRAASLDASAWSDPRVWAAVVVLLGLGFLLVRPAFAEA